MPEPSSTLMRGLLEAFLLERLSRAPKHGYALLKELADLFGDEPNRNKIYPLLQKLEREGFVEAAAEGDQEGRPKTSYRLTERGLERLEEYRRMPRPFREAVARFWTEDLPPTPGAGPPAPVPAARPPAPTHVPVTPHPVAPPALAPPAPPMVRPQEITPSTGDALPYPCPDARVGLSKDPRTGNLSLQLSGCPMGAYAYCPQCPIYGSVQGLKKLVFG